MLELIVGIPYTFLFYYLGQRYISQSDYGDYANQHLKWAYWYRISLLVIYMFLQMLVYGKNDTDTYLYQIGEYVNLLFSSPSQFIHALSLSRSELAHAFGIPNDALFVPSNLAISKAGIIPYMLAFGTRYGTSLFFAMASYITSAKLYYYLHKIFPSQSKYLFWAIFFVPNIVIWSSPLAKDPLCFAAIVYFTSLLIKIHWKYKVRFSEVLLSIILLIAVYFIKNYILATVLTSSLIFLFASFITRIKNIILKVSLYITLMAAFVIVFVAAGDYIVDVIMTNIQEEVVDKLIAHNLDYDQGKAIGGSAYEIGEFEPTVAGLLQMFPKAIFYCYYKPFIWEFKNPLIITVALESNLILLFTIWVIIRRNFSLIGRIINSPLMSYLISFVLLFGFIIGMSSGTYGAMSRYRIIGELFLILSLIILNMNRRDYRISLKMNK